MRLWLIRHGETDWNRERRCQGTSDLDLNETGLRQAEAIANRLKDVTLAAVHASPLKRALQTALAFAKPVGLEVHLEPGLMELDQGIFEGAVMDEAAKTHPDVIREWILSPADMVLPGGESMRQLQERAWPAIKKIASSYPPDAQVAAVSHNLAISTILCKVLDLSLNQFRKIRLSPAGISVVEFSPLGVALVSMNSTYHLESENS